MDKKMKIAYPSVDQYILAYPEEIQEILAKIRSVIRKKAPDALEIRTTFVVQSTLPPHQVTWNLRKNFQNTNMGKAQFNFP